MSRHRSARPRYGRIVVAMAAVVVTALSVLGGVGVIASSPSAAGGERLAAAIEPSQSPSGLETSAAAPAEPTLPGPSAPAQARAEIDAEALPAGSGQGRRVVFSEEAQRVWLVRKDGSVRRTYLVSGSLLDNLDPGRYSVFSTSRWAVGIDDSGVMEYFVRFAHGESAAIGFHTIPTKLGTALQSRAQLGTPQSHGCIRQARADAIALWKFAPEGSSVVVI
ncbi:ErfK/YbiS/YcfS/YnhG family protein [Nocardioides sp. CF8]|uniref:L,D-transpeptidase n=1 Tax=Nocardioides sp. CF8 TaxID=110319 RepID=UPI0003310E97|nr:L,D-transpeptidase [Nocardioides sp. CF8]EON24738.1 ErfK/YbiS/YcfS/YnhG family protein [Nocardioides sp. CF8]